VGQSRSDALGMRLHCAWGWSGTRG